MNKNEQTAHCPICQKNVQEIFSPFCSKRCSDVDLGRWLTDYYVVSDVELDTPLDSQDEQEE